MATVHELYNFLWAQNFKNWNVQVIFIYWNLKCPPQVDLLNICDRQISNLINDGGWYRTSSLLLIMYEVCLFQQNKQF